MADTVRSVSELLDALFASGQAPRSITEQDVRDAIVSISLETADFSDLPRSSVDLQVGRCWIDTTTALRVVTAYLPGLASAATLDGRSSLFADGQIPGRLTFPGSSTIGGSAAFTANVSFVRQSTSIRLNGTVATTPGITIIKQTAAAGLSGAAGYLAIPSPISSGSFSSAFSSAFQFGQSLATQQNASATLSPTATIIATPQRGTTTTWDPTATSIYITLSGSSAFSTAFSAAFPTSGLNLIATKTGFNGWYGGVRATTLRSSGKWYWEISIGTKTGDTGVGFANPSWAIDNSDPTFGSYLGSDTNSVGLYNNGATGNAIDGTGSNISPMPNVVTGGNIGIALDCDNWKWWARQDGGAWNVGQPGTQDPATNQGGLAIDASHRVGGVAPAITLQAVNDVVTGRFSSTSWGFTPPTGFAAI